MTHDRLQEAAEWWLQLREANVAPETIAKWMRWCDARAENLEAFESVQALWQKAGSAPLRPVARDELVENNSPRVSLPWALAAGLAVALMGGTLYFLTAHQDSARLHMAGQGNTSTQVGSTRELALPDGSQVTLGAASGLRTAFTADRRAVLLERGEAFFNVEKDEQRPFVVMTGNVAVTAIGTAFNVRADAGTLRVTVAEGVVEVKRRFGSDTRGMLPNTRIRAGEEIDLHGLEVGPVMPSTVRRVDPSIAVAWTSGALKFRDEPLSAVVATVNRYSSTSIELNAEGMKGFRYTGTVVAGRIDEWLTALPNAFPVEIVSHGHDRVRIEPRNR
jgi:transmembrane sensor